MSDVVSVGIVLDDVFLRHAGAPGFPERPERVHAISGALERAGLRNRLHSIETAKATDDDLLRIHSASYIRRLQQACAEGRDELDSSDCPLTADTESVARTAAGSALKAVDAVFEGQVRRAFCAVRPPGHHAEHDRAMGFCYYNTIAVAARYAQVRHGARRIFIFDWDVHHGNGTQNSFYQNPDVFYCSIHGHPMTLFPGTGFANEVGRGAGEGTTLNIPLMPRSGSDRYREAVFEQILPTAEKFRPELLLVSAGFDAHRLDPIGNQALESQDFAWMTETFKRFADEQCGGRFVSVLEGGYDTHALGESVVAHVEQLL